MIALLFLSLFAHLCTCDQAVVDSDCQQNAVNLDDGLLFPPFWEIEEVMRGLTINYFVEKSGLPHTLDKSVLNVYGLNLAWDLAVHDQTQGYPDFAKKVIDNPKMAIMKALLKKMGKEEYFAAAVKEGLWTEPKERD